MSLDRRALIGALGLGVAASVATAAAQEAPAAPPAQPSLADRITQRAAENRHRLAYDGSRFSGPAYDLLVQEGRAAQYFCIGEEHGIAKKRSGSPPFAPHAQAAHRRSGGWTTKSAATAA